MMSIEMMSTEKHLQRISPELTWDTSELSELEKLYTDKGLYDFNLECQRLIIQKKINNSKERWRQGNG